MLESILQATIYQTIKSLLPDIKFISSTNGQNLKGLSHQQKAILIKELKSQGQCKGEADFRLLLPKGITLNIELKVGANTQQASQIEYEQDLKELGHHYAVCYSLTETLSIINEHLDVEYRQKCLEAYRGDLPTIIVKKALKL